MKRRGRYKYVPTDDCPKGLLAFWNEGIEKDIPLKVWRRMAARKFALIGGKPRKITDVIYWEETFNLVREPQDNL